MSRRVYYMTPKGRQVREEALAALRETKKNLDPGLLDRLRGAVAAYASNSKPEETADAGRMVPVDMKKNLTIVMKYLEMNRGNSSLYRQIQALLAEIS